MNKYKGEVIHLIGGLHEYLGTLDPKDHPSGPHWYRINNPCTIFLNKNEAMNRVETVVLELSGPKKAYRKFVDVYIPPDCHVEIRVLDKNGELYEVYNKERNRIKPDRIIVPEGSGVSLPPKLN